MSSIHRVPPSITPVFRNLSLFCITLHGIPPYICKQLIERTVISSLFRSMTMCQGEATLHLVVPVSCLPFADGTSVSPNSFPISVGVENLSGTAVTNVRLALIGGERGTEKINLLFVCLKDFLNTMRHHRDSAVHQTRRVEMYDTRSLLLHCCRPPNRTQDRTGDHLPSTGRQHISHLAIEVGLRD